MAISGAIHAVRWLVCIPDVSIVVIRLATTKHDTSSLIIANGGDYFVKHNCGSIIPLSLSKFRDPVEVNSG